MSRTVFFQDTRGSEYAGVDRVVGLIFTDQVVIHTGLPGFLGPEFIPPTIQQVMHRQVFSKARAERRRTGGR